MEIATDKKRIMGRQIVDACERATTQELITDQHRANASVAFVLGIIAGLVLAVAMGL